MMKHSKHGKNEKARHLMRRSGYALGGAMPMSPTPAGMGQPAQMPMKLKEGGAVEGKASGGRLDKMARGGRKSKAHVTVNVMNHPQTPISPSIPPIPVGLGAAGPGGPRPMPSPAPMGGGAPGVPPMGPGGMKRGGRHKSKMAEGGEPTQGYSKGKIPEPAEEKHLKSGGRLGGKAAPHMTGGSGSGVGREEKSALVKEKPKAR